VKNYDENKCRETPKPPKNTRTPLLGPASVIS
jgi:hypothetical protein